MNLKHFALVLGLLFSNNAHSIVGWADWEATTPNGHKIINHPRHLGLKKGAVSQNEIFYNGKDLFNIYSWYFYKDNIIGVIYDDNLAKTKGLKKVFFVFDEKTLFLKTFDSQDAWSQYVESQNLEPKTWKRIYKSDWEGNGLIFNLLLFIIPFSLIFFLYYLIVKFILKLKKMKFKNKLIFSSFLISIIVFLHHLSTLFPQSF